MAYINGAIDSGSIPDPEAPVSFSFDAGSSSNRVLKVWVSINDSGGHSPDTVTYNGVSLTPDGVAVEQTTTRIRGYTLAGPAAGSNYVVTTFTGGFGRPLYHICAGVWDNIDQATPQDNYNSGSGTDTTAELAQTSEVGDTPVFCVAWNAVTPTNITATQGWTNRVQAITGSIITAFGDGTGASLINFTASLSAVAPNSWVVLGANLNAATGGGGGSSGSAYYPLPRGLVRGWNRKVL